MQSIRKSRLCFLLLGIVLSSAQAAATAVECTRAGMGGAPLRHGGASFTWTPGPAAQDAAPDAPFSMALWGDSLTSATHFIDAVLKAWGIPRQAVVPSFVQAGMKVAGLSLPLRTHCASNGWKLAYAHKEGRSQGGFSRGFVSMSSDTPGDTLFLDFRSPAASTRLQGLTIVYDKARPDGSLMLAVSVDGGQEEMISLSRTPGATLHIKPDAPMATLRIRLVSGQITLHGFEPLYQEAPEAIVDALSVPGATLRSWSRASERYFAAARQVPDYRLVLIQYGTNEGAARFDRQAYLAYLRSNLERMRSFYPRSRCILIGPPDRGAAGSAGAPGSLKYSRIHQQIALAQRQVGGEYRCEFWDWQAAMGGAGAALRWSAMSPPLMQQDLTHLTAKGYETSGRMFAQAFPYKQ